MYNVYVYVYILPDLSFNILFGKQYRPVPAGRLSRLSENGSDTVANAPKIVPGNVFGDKCILSDQF